VRDIGRDTPSAAFPRSLILLAFPGGFTICLCPPQPPTDQRDGAVTVVVNVGGVARLEIVYCRTHIVRRAAAEPGQIVDPAYKDAAPGEFAHVANRIHPDAARGGTTHG
jgi:hypothetical protein